MSGRTVHKFELAIRNEQWIDMPKGAIPVHTDVQFEDYLCLWCEVDPEMDNERVKICVRGTGHPIEDDLVHIGSALMHGGSLVWHVYREER